MATYDWTGTDVIPNGSGSAVRADLNDALLALFSQNSSNSAPTTTVGYMLWADPDDGYLKIRDGSSSGVWYNLFKLNGEWSPLKLVNGTAAEPSLQFSASGTDTGFFSPALNHVGITAGGGFRARFGSGEIVFNEILADVDFRVAGTSQPDLFKVDAGTNTVRVITLADSAGANTSTPAQIASGRAKAWVNFNGTGTVAIRASYNVSSITDNGTGNYTVNLTAAMADINFTVVVEAATPAGYNINGTTTTNLSSLSTQIGVVGILGTSNVAADSAQVNVAIFR